MRNYREEAERALAMQGGYYTFDDIIERVRDGRMQSFCRGNTLVVTQVNEFPRKTVLDISLVVGDLEDLRSLEPEILQHMENVGADMVMATGRLGWLKRKLKGWRALSVTFVRD